MEFNEADRELFNNVAFLVEADHNAYFQLWCEYSKESDHPRNKDHVVDWKGEAMGRWVQIAEMESRVVGHAKGLGVRPICVSIQFVVICGHRVAFYYGSSQLVDHELIENWLRLHTGSIRYDNGVRWAHCNAENFQNCISEIRSRGN